MFAGGMKVWQRTSLNLSFAHLIPNTTGHWIMSNDCNFTPESWIRILKKQKLIPEELRCSLTALKPVCHSHSYKPSVFKLLEVDEVNSSSNSYIFDFLYSWPEVRSISWPAHVKSMGKISTTSFSHQNISIHWEWCWLRSSVMTQATVFIGDPPKVIWGHLRSPNVFCE